MDLPVETMALTTGRLPAFTPYRFVSPDYLLDTFSLSNEGIPVRVQSDSRLYVNPLCAAYYGLAVLTRDPDALDVARKQYDFLQEISTSIGTAQHLQYTIDHPRFGVTAPWSSAITQGIAISFCLRLYAQTSEMHFIDTAKALCEVLAVDVADSGVRCTTDSGQQWFEEYPGVPRSHVLNGHLFAMIAILEMRMLGIALEQLPSTDTLIRDVCAAYPTYRCGRFLRYSKYDYSMCNAHYMGLHALLFVHLYHLTGQLSFRRIVSDLATVTNWRGYLRSVGADMNKSVNWLDGWLREEAPQS